jgi:hypothetical protein
MNMDGRDHLGPPFNSLNWQPGEQMTNLRRTSVNPFSFMPLNDSSEAAHR